MERSGLAEKRKAEGRPPLHFHDLRHTAATLYAQETKDLYMVSKFPGHSSTKMTERYAHIVEERRRDAAAAVAGIIHGPKCHKNVTIGNFGHNSENGGVVKTAVNEGYLVNSGV